MLDVQSSAVETPSTESLQRHCAPVSPRAHSSSPHCDSLSPLTHLLVLIVSDSWYSYSSSEPTCSTCNIHTATRFTRESLRAPSARTR